MKTGKGRKIKERKIKNRYFNYKKKIRLPNILQSDGVVRNDVACVGSKSNKAT